MENCNKITTQQQCHRRRADKFTVATRQSTKVGGAVRPTHGCNRHSSDHPSAYYDVLGCVTFNSRRLGTGHLGQPWPYLDHLPLLPLLSGIAFHLQLALLSYHPIFLRPHHFLKLVSFLGANRTKSASVCLWLLMGAM